MISRNLVQNLMTCALISRLRGSSAIGLVQMAIGVSASLPLGVLGLASFSSTAHALCTGLNTAVVNCTGTDTGNVTSTFAGGSVTNTLNTWIHTSGGYTSNITGVGNNTLMATGSTISTIGSGIIVTSQGGAVQISASTTDITTTPSGAYGILGRSTTGDIAIEYAGGIITAGAKPRWRRENRQQWRN